MHKPERPHVQRLSSITGNADADYILDLGTGIGEAGIETESLKAEVALLNQDVLADVSSSPAPAAGVGTQERARIWRSRSYERRLTEVSEAKVKVIERKGSMDQRDCGICFEPALHPRRVPCCQTLFCREHITDWLTGPNASRPGLCPSCDTPCTYSTSRDSILVLSSSSPTCYTSPSDTSAIPPAHGPTLAPPETTAGIGEVDDEWGGSGGRSRGGSRSVTPHPLGSGQVLHPHEQVHESLVDVGGIKGPGE